MKRIVRFRHAVTWKKQLRFAIAFFIYIRLKTSDIRFASVNGEYNITVPTAQYHFCGRQKYHAEEGLAYHIHLQINVCKYHWNIKTIRENETEIHTKIHTKQ